MSAEAIQDPIVRRLVYGKYLLARAQDAMQGGGHVAPGIAILALQDGVELIVRAIGTHVGATWNQQNAAFSDLLTAIRTARPDLGEVPYRQQLLGLNRSRVNFKHDGNLPNATDVRGYMQAAQRFAAEAVPRYLDGRAWDSISLADLVQHRRCANHLRLAEQHRDRGELQSALESCGTAFDALFQRDHDEKPLYSPWSLRGLTGQAARLADRDQGTLEGYLRALEGTLDNHEALLLLLLEGVDLGRLRRFLTALPAGALHGPTTRIGYALWHTSPSSESVDFCIAFVIETALCVEEAALENPAWRPVRPRYQVASPTKVLLKPRPDAEVIRSVEAGEVLIGPTGSGRGGEGEFTAVMQDRAVAYVLREHLVQLREDSDGQ